MVALAQLLPAQISPVQTSPVEVIYHTPPPPLPIIWYIFAAMLGACIGSFLNVVIYRLPEGRSIVNPPSACPRCNHQLAWYDNVPILGWLWLRGRCRYCRTPVSLQYPIIEAITAAFFALTLYFFYDSGLRNDFTFLSLETTWIVLLLYLLLVASLIAASKIDAQLFIIPLEIPWVVTVIALIAAPLAAAWDGRSLDVLPALTTWQIGAAAGGLVGLIAAIFLLHRGILPHSFNEEPPATDKATSTRKKQPKSPPPAAPPTPVTPVISVPGAPSLRRQFIFVLSLAVVCIVASQFGPLGLLVTVSLLWWGGLLADFGAYGPSAFELENPEDWLAYPNPRLEALKEALFLLLPTGGFILGGVIGDLPAISERLTSLPAPAEAFAGALFGYLAAAGVYWAVRIVFTIAFGKEAMGLGDVHLMAAVGAIAGWLDASLALFVAAPFGLVFAITEMIAGRLTKKISQPIPFGPHLAGATLVLIFFHDPIYVFLADLLTILQQIGIIPV